MNTNRIFLGNLMCGKDLVRENVVLLKCNGGFYVQLNDVKNLIDLHKINRKKTNLKIYRTIENDGYYVLENSLVSYYEQPKHKTLKKIKLDVLVDARNPIGIDW